MIKYCIFDLDGTLLNTLPTITHHLNVMLRHYGLSDIDDSRTKRYVGNGTYMRVFRALDEQGAANEETLRDAYAFYVEISGRAPDYLTEIYEGIPEMLDALAEKGIKLLMISNKADSAAVKLMEKFFPGRFALVHGEVAGKPLKPDPTLALEMLAELGASPSECAFIGDSDVDMFTGKNIGVALNVGVLWGFRDKAELVGAGADVTVSHPSEIVERITEYGS